VEYEYFGVAEPPSTARQSQVVSSEKVTIVTG